jgi:hypothetical protein
LSRTESYKQDLSQVIFLTDVQLAVDGLQYGSHYIYHYITVFVIVSVTVSVTITVTATPYNLTSVLR